jgi:hypothetical protein
MITLGPRNTLKSYERNRDIAANNIDHLSALPKCWCSLLCGVGVCGAGLVDRDGKLR